MFTRCVGKKNFAEKHIQTPKGASFPMNFGARCSNPEGQGLSKEVRYRMFGKTEANEGCAHAVAGKHGRSNLFFFECLQGLANAEYFAIRNLRKPDRAVEKENRGVSGRKEMFDVFVGCGSKGSLEKQRGGKLVLNVRGLR